MALTVEPFVLSSEGEKWTPGDSLGVAKEFGDLEEAKMQVGIICLLMALEFPSHDVDSLIIFKVVEDGEVRWADSYMEPVDAPAFA